MQDGFTIFWQNNNRARALFDDLVARIHRNAYDDDYLAVLDAYQAESPDSAHFYILAAHYLADTTPRSRSPSAPIACARSAMRCGISLPRSTSI